MARIAVLTSGGDSPGMNAFLRGAVKVAAAQGVHVVGVRDGYEGLMDGSFEPLTVQDGATVRPAPAFEADLIGGMGGTVLGSARSMRFREPGGRSQAAKRLAEMDGLIVVGGNGSLTGAHMLANEHGIKVMGVPASIDNDIGCTSTCLGVDTALNTIVQACDRIADTARAHKRAFVVEVMGRDCGYLAMASAIAAGADAALIREQGRAESEIVEATVKLVRHAFAERGKRRVLIIKAEGVEVPCTKLVREVDEKIKDLGVDIRGTVLGHVVRGGNPSFLDRMVASRLALGAVSALLSGCTDEMVSWQPQVEGGTKTLDPSVQRFPLARVLEETKALIDGSSPITQRRLKLMEAAEGVLPL
ncbi:MAG: 6-phosphofructokinase [Deltaproteobacteria bacterium]|nr:6-phosphofructokinase [Deltaproteobacteria bacterium]